MKSEIKIQLSKFLLPCPITGARHVWMGAGICSECGESRHHFNRESAKAKKLADRERWQKERNR